MKSDGEHIFWAKDRNTGHYTPFRLVASHTSCEPVGSLPLPPVKGCTGCAAQGMETAKPPKREAGSARKGDGPVTK